MFELYSIQEFEMKFLLIFLFMAFGSSMGQDLSNLTPAQMVVLQEKMKKAEQSSKVEVEEKSVVTNELELEMAALENQTAEEVSLEGALNVPASKRYASQVFSLASSKLFAATSNQVSSDYPLKFGDKLVLSIWGGPEKEIPLTLDRSGNVIVPDAGRVSLNGLSLYSAEQLLKRKLKKSMVGLKLGVAQISLRVQELSPMKIYVLGDVKRPSAYVLQGNSSVLNALYMAGGPNEIGSVRRVKITRGRRSYEIDLYDYLMKGVLPKKRLLRDGDVVFVPKAEKLVEIKGAVNRPAIYELKEKEMLKELVGFAAGKTANAGYSLSVLGHDEEGNSVLEELEGARAKLEGKEKFVLQNSDVVTLRSNLSPVSNYVKVIGSVVYPGMYSWSVDYTLDSVLSKSGGVLTTALDEAVSLYRKQKDGTYQLLTSGLDKSSLNMKIEMMDSIFVPSSDLVKTGDFVSISGAVQFAKQVAFTKGLTAKTLFLQGGGGTLNWKEGSFVVERRMEGQKKILSEEINLSPSNFLSELDKIVLEGGERLVLVSNPNFYSGELIKVDGGAVLSPGDYPLQFKGETLSHFLKRVVLVSDDVQWSGAKFYRQRGGGKYPITLNFEDVVEDVVEGSDGGQIKMREGDRIYIPEREFTVRVLGEVTSPGDVLYNKKLDYEEYVNRAGGYSRFGDEDRVLIVLANGARVKADEFDGKITAGSSILVGYIPEEEPIKWGEIIQASISTVGAIAAVILTIVIIDEKIK